MADVEISYKGNEIATMSATGVKTLLTGDTFCEDDIIVSYTKPSAPAPILQTKSETYNPTTSQQTDSITADVGYDGLDQVDITINAVATGTAGTPTATKGTVSSHSIAVTPSVTNTTGYITGGTINGTAVTVSASELVSGTLSITSSGTKDVTNYASASVASGSASTPATSITANPTISVSASGLITASVSGSKSVTPSVSAGYVSSGTAGTVSVSGSNTQQLTTQSAQTITPTTTNQTIASGKYLTGTQTIKGDANLLAGNIKKDVVLFGITGTYEGGGGGLQVYSSTDYSDGIFTLPQGVSDADLQSNVKAITATNIQIYFNNADLYTLSSIGCTMNYSGSLFFISGVAMDNYLFYLGFTYTAESGFILNDLMCYSFADADFVDVAIASVGSFDFIK